MKTHFLLALLWLVPWFVRAQAVTIRGVVRTQSDGLPLPGATVLEKGTAHGASSDAQGRFTLVVASRASRLVVSSVGYVTKEVALPRATDSLTVMLAEDSKSLSEVVVTGYGAAAKGKASAPLAGRVAGARIRGASSLAASSVAVSTVAADKALHAGPAVRAGTLTAGEINDFGKWKLWPDVAQKDLSEWRGHWRISPLERYAAQLVTEDGFPVVGATVRLKNERGAVLWLASSDNTGKCELWNNLFAGGAPQQVAVLEAVVDGKTYEVGHPSVFQNGLNTIRVKAPCRVPAVVDVAFVVDATGSMGDEIEYLQAELGAVIGTVKDSLAASTVNLGSVFYRDAGDEYVTRISPLSPDIQRTVGFIRDQRADGGGDTPEAVDAALAAAVSGLAWSPEAKARLLFLILDAPPHENAQVLASLQASIRAAAAKGIRIIPIAASGIDKSTEYLMRSMALATNGTYVVLTDDSGVGNAHLKPTTDKFEVERLNDLLVRLIVRYAYVADCRARQASKTDQAGTPAAQPRPAADSLAVGGQRRAKPYAWKCYPNPVSEVLHVELDGGVAELFVTDVTGKIVLRAVPTRDRATLQLGSFPTGIYFLTFYAGKKWEKAKFLVSR